MKCDEKNCNETDNLTQCRLTMFKGDAPWFWYFQARGLIGFLTGFVHLWNLHNKGWTNLYEYYCAFHAKRNGYCFACGEFWAGSENFDFGPGYCSNCAVEFEEPEYEDDFYYDAYDYDPVDLWAE